MSHNSASSLSIRQFRIVGPVLVGAVFAVAFAPTQNLPAAGVNPSMALVSQAGLQLPGLTPAMNRVPAVATRAVPAVASVNLLDELRVAMQSRDSVRATAAIDGWLAPGAAGVDQLFTILGNARDRSDLDGALGAILRRAVLDADGDPDRFDPWTPSSIIERSVELIGASAGNASALRRGLAGLGRFAEPSHLVDLIRYQGAQGDNIHDTSHQIDAIRLMQDWARDPALPVEAELDAVLVDPEGSPLARARATEMLLQRDWRAHVDTLVEQLDALEVASLGDAHEVDTLVRLQLSSFVGYLEPHEQVEYLNSLAPDLSAFRSATNRLDEDEALALLAAVDLDQLSATHVACLELRAGTDRAVDAAIALLPVLEQEPTAAAYSCVHRVIELDGGLDPEFHSVLSGLFQRRGEERDPFWRAVGWNPRKLTDGQVEDAIVPWLYLSQGEEHRTRDELVAHVQDRFPGRYSNL